MNKIEKRVYSNFNWIKDDKIPPYQLLLDKYPDSKFIWLDAYEYEHEIEYMETPHLYYTSRMIWNYLCKEDVLIIDTKVDYDFSENPIYCDAYFKMGINAMLNELLSRKNPKQVFKKNIDFMKLNIKYLT